MSRKAVFFDIDGTLWDEHFVIPESTKEGNPEAAGKWTAGISLQRKNQSIYSG